MAIGRKIPLAIERYLLDIAIIAIMAIIYAPLLIHWYDGWLNKSISIEHEYFSHGLIGLPFAAYIIWTQREEWRKIPDNAHPLGMVFLILGGISYLSGQSELVNLSFPTILAGLCLWLKGMPGFKLQFVPWLLIFFATPNAAPYLIEPWVLPLQTFIAGTAGFILLQFGLDITVVGTNLFVGGRIVEVAPHCAGLKMLFTSLYVGLMLLYWSGALKSRRNTILLLSGAAAISVTANILRNTLLTLFHGTGQEGAFEWLHEGWGGDFYSACMLGTLVLLLNVIEGKRQR
ncbi:cyanoexosortase B [Limnofasciculus baicalensis]|uniref:Cyanoexosortase B n=1 Tax=Limnofasciculus baicalensis BBK-W-15 TaxID=2699891 RepID=A0AAE3KSX3_9CYAN|nr:cyanoexosortase B [Limnofasciculus baicalensis]MCP2729917.1 cyanoexosortase B [Limnofasciculus baicalensis BBK-W-15]